VNESLSGVVAAIRVTGDLLGEAAQQLPAVDPGATAFGAGGPGRLGELGRDLYLQWQRGVDARVREAHAHAARVHDLADLASHTAGGFADANESARSEHRDEGGTGATAGVV
jgi:hypothetical protein